MNKLGAVQDCRPHPIRKAFILTEANIARLMLALTVVTSTFFWYVNIALGATFTLQDGKRIEGEIIYASASSVIVRERTGALAQLGRRTIDQVEIATDTRGIVAGTLESWTEGVYEIKIEDKFFKVQASRIIAERWVSPEIIITAAEEREDAAELVFKLGLSAPAQQEVLLIFSTSDGTALAGTDYEAVRGNVILKPGSTEAVVSIPLLDDALAEGTETFELLVTSDLDLETVKVKRGSAKILDNDAPAAASQ